LAQQWREIMTKIFTGKTKDVYQLEDGNIKLVFKDDMTGADGVFDPGANTVGLTVEGAGLAGLNMSVHYFKLLEEKGYPTQFISAEENTMTVKQATPFGGGLEVICRYKAMGSFIRRYGGIVKEGTALDAVVEMTLKDDARGDPLINEDALVAIGILKTGEYAEIKALTTNICEVIKNDIAAKGMELCDIKLEFGKDKQGKIILIDEISGGNMRVLENGYSVPPLELSKRLVYSFL
jgi:phosphoribosylaminoimidazole-succinocarboxamide synthase